MIRRRIGHHDVSAQLGEGAMGVVYRAHGTRLGRDAAIKVLPDTQELFRIPVLEAPIIHFQRGRLP